MVDTIIIGGGPAGLSAGIYSGRARKETLIIDKGDCTACRIDRLDNYLGFPQGLRGEELIERGREQARRFGCAFLTQEVLGARQEDEATFIVETEEKSYSAQALILATGALHKKTNIRGIEPYEGRGVSYCVQCDGPFFRGEKVVVIGSENLAGKEVIDLANYTQDIHLFTNGREVRMSERILGWLRQHRIPIHSETIVGIAGAKELKGLELETGGIFPCQGVFVALGSSGAVDIGRKLGIVIEGNFIQVEKGQRTSIPRVYAAGDCTGANRQIAVAMGAGANAAINLVLELNGTGWTDHKARFR